MYRTVRFRAIFVRAHESHVVRPSGRDFFLWTARKRDDKYIHVCTSQYAFKTCARTAWYGEQKNGKKSFSIGARVESAFVGRGATIS